MHQKSDPCAPSALAGRMLLALALPLLPPSLVGCSEQQDARLSTLLITLDTTRADALPCYGNRDGKMPNLDAFAAQSLVYDAAHTVTPLTLPSHASMLTGLYPVRHGVRVNGPRPLSDEAWTLAEAARAAGIQTAAFVSASVLNAPMGLAQGFEYFGGVAGERPSGYHELERPAGDVVSEALAWFAKRDAKRPFFAWLHLFDPHAPSEPNAEFKGRTSNAYLDELAYVDQELGRLLDALDAQGLMQRTLMVICADHGESFGEHDEDNHGWLAYEGVLRVPMLLRYPDASGAGERSQETVSVVDIGPTLASAMQITLGSGLDGQSLFGVQVAAERGVYFETYQGFEAQGWSPIIGWLDHSGKYIHSSSPEWYNQRLDIQEKYNLINQIDTSPYIAAIQELAQRPRLKESAARVDAQQMNSIEALGYAASTNETGELPELLAPTGLPIPREMIKEERLLRKAMLLHTQNRFSQARPLLTGILQRNPNNKVASEMLGFGYNSERLYPEAEQVLRRLAESGTRWPNVLCLLGYALEKQGRTEAARDAYMEALAEDPRWQPAIDALAKLP